MHTSIGLIALVTLIVAASAAAQDRPNHEDEILAAQFLVGTWNCADTVGDHAGTYITTITPLFGGRWLRQVYTWPVSRSMPKGLHGEFFLGFDPRNGKWIRQGVLDDGMYFAMTGRRVDNVWTYGYSLPSTVGTAVYTKVSETAYTVLGPSYPENGRQVTERHGCHKQG